MGVEVKTSNRITICGMTGTGKTVFAKSLMMTMSSETNPVGVLDPLDQFADIEEEGVLERVVPPPNQEGAMFDAMADRAMKRGNMSLFGEEAEMYVPERGKVGDPAMRAILRGRNRGVGITLITRRIAMLSKNFFSLSDHVFIFRHFSPNDISYLADFVGPETARRFMDLPDYYFAHFANGKTDFLKPIKIPTVPSARS
ncbi:MAG: ATP-binding protein [Candidatus Glassbacteria bacterium]|nr:ATP-binding protein [Candidatus Glassbacteria bacterium]